MERETSEGKCATLLRKPSSENPQDFPRLVESEGVVTYCCRMQGVVL
jgi:hypothetical protein